MKCARENSNIAPFYCRLPQTERIYYVQNKPASVHFESLAVASVHQVGGRQLLFVTRHDAERWCLRDKKSTFGATV
jgi:hypothetical protein